MLKILFPNPHQPKNNSPKEVKMQGKVVIRNKIVAPVEAKKVKKI